MKFSETKNLESITGQQDDDDLPIPDIEGMVIQKGKLGYYSHFGVGVICQLEEMCPRI